MRFLVFGMVHAADAPLDVIQAQTLFGTSTCTLSKSGTATRSSAT